MWIKENIFLFSSETPLWASVTKFMPAGPRLPAFTSWIFSSGFGLLSFAFQLRTMLLLLFCFLTIISASISQDLNNIDKENPVKISGGLNVRTIFYSAKGIENRRNPFSYVITGSPVVSIYNVEIPVSFVFSEQERNFRQPFNQFGLSPTYKWLTVHAGYRNVNFSPYTLAGHTMLGGGVEMNPGIFRFGFMYGRLNRATAIDTTSGSLQPFNYTRRGYAVKAGIGKEHRFLDFSIVKAKDDSLSAPVRFSERKLVTPAENVVFGMGSRITFLKQFYWEGDAGFSFYTNNINSSLHFDSLEHFPAIIDNTLGKLISINGSTEFYSAYQTSIGYKSRPFSLKLQYRRIDPRYQSMGAYFFNNDVENITISPSFVLFKQRFRFSGSVGLQRDNLQNQKQATTNRVIGSANASADITERLGVDIGFTNFSNNQRARTILLADSFLLAQTTRNISITPRYVLQKDGYNHMFLLSYNRMELMDQNSHTAELNNIQSHNIFFNYQIYLLRQHLNLFLNINSTKLEMISGRHANEGVTIGANKKLLENKLLIGLTSSVLRGTRAGMQSMILNNGFRGEMQVGKMHRFNLLLNVINNKPEQQSIEENHREFREIRGEIGYNFNF